MKVSDLIEKLKTMPQDAEVKHVWDGGAYTTIQHVWLSRSGIVMTADFDMPVYNEEDRSAEMPNEKEKKYYYTEKGPSGESNF